jgi:uncharacterized protein with PQ loop repeat
MEKTKAIGFIAVFCVAMMMLPSIGLAATSTSTDTDYSGYVAIKKEALDDLRLAIAEGDKDTKLFIEQKIEDLRRELKANDDANTRTLYEKHIFVEQEMLYLSDPLRSNITIIMFIIAVSSFMLWVYGIDKMKSWMNARLYARKVLDLSNDKEKLIKKAEVFEGKVKEYEEAIRMHEANALALRRMAEQEKRRAVRERATPSDVKMKDVFSGEQGVM